MDKKQYCLCMPNKCQDKYRCCGTCLKINKCQFDKCRDNPKQCAYLATEEEVEEYMPKNHMVFNKYGKKSVDEILEEKPISTELKVKNNDNKNLAIEELLQVADTYSS